MDTTNKAIEDALKSILQSRQNKKNSGQGQSQEQDPRLKQPGQKDKNDDDNQQGSSKTTDSNKSNKDSNSSKSNSNGVKGSKGAGPQIGDQGDPDIQAAEEAERQANEYKEAAEQASKEAKKAGDDNLQGQADKLADKADKLSKEAKDIKDDIKDKDGAGDAEKARLKKIQDKLNDAEIQKKALDETERAVFTSRQLEADKKRRREYENNPAKRFIQSVEMFIKDQIAYQRTDSWKRPSKKQAPGGIISKGKARNYNTPIPLINVYFDRSGSWDDEKIKVGQQAIASLKDLEKKGKIKIGVYYFANHVHSNPQEAEHEGGTSATQEILDHIKATHANNVIIMTDDDMDRQGSFTVPVKVDGAVWFCFKGGRCKKIMQYLHGAKMTKAYDL